MTAIDKYIRLEAVGQWRESPDTDGREVIVSFGDATLVLSDMNETPLSHWALAGMQRLSLTGAKAVYTTDTQGFETLEIDDADMVEAISQVSRLTVSQKPKKRKGFGLWIAFLALLIGVVALGPMVLRQQARAMTSPETKRYFGYQMIEAARLSQCQSPEGSAARDGVMERNFPDDEVRLLVVDLDVDPKFFPGGLIVLSETSLQSFLTPSDFVNWLNIIGNTTDRTLEDVFLKERLTVVMRYITSGELPEDIIRMTALGLMVNQNLPSIENAGDPVEFLMRPQDWQALRQICLD